MGDTEAKVSRSIWLTRIILAGLVFAVGVIAALQLIIFPQITIKFETGADAQQISSIKIKRGSSVDLPVPLKPGSYFVGWSLNKTSGEILEDSKTLRENGTTLYAVWDGVEKYGVFLVNGIPWKNADIILDTSGNGFTPDDLNAKWYVTDDYDESNPDLIPLNADHKINPKNNYQRFLGWRYLNAENQYNDLLCDNGVWTWVKRDAQGNVIEEITITNENKFYPPNYRTTFNALLEFRKFNFQYYLKGKNNPFVSQIFDANATDVEILPYDVSEPSDKFSHWQIEIIGKDVNSNRKVPTDYATEEILAQIKTYRFTAGEKVDINPLWYYLGTDIPMLESVSSNNTVVNIALRATDWTDEATDKYTFQTITDTDLGETYQTIPQQTFDDLSMEQPVIYSEVGYEKSICLLYSPEILSYSFYDHRGVYHEVSTSQLTANTMIPLGREKVVGDKTVFFNQEWAINVKVKYQKSLTDIILRFNYGTELYTLPAYRLNHNVIVQEYLRNVGNHFTLLSAEKYLKEDYLFYGWKIKGDTTETIYTAGSTYLIPAMDTATNRVIEFEAVWKLSRLLFDFDFNGGDWAETPNYKCMKGAYGDRVQIVPDVPVRFGYDFVGWSLNNDPTILQPGEYIVVGTEIQTLHAHWERRRLRLIFYTKTSNSEQLQPDPIYSQYYVEDELELPDITENSFYRFLGWKIGKKDDNVDQNQILAARDVITLNADLIQKFENEDLGDLIQVNIYAEQERIVTQIEYKEFKNNQFYDLDIPNVMDPATWVTELVQGAAFTNYKPFTMDNRQLHMQGREFLGWEYYAVINNRVDSQPIKKDIDGNENTIDPTIVPYGVKNLIVYPVWSEAKNYIIEYYDFNGNLLTEKTDYGENNHGYTYSNTPNLLLRNEAGIELANDDWGTFVGWSVTQDYKAGNPEIIYNIKDYDYQEVKLQLASETSTLIDRNHPYYQVAIDQYDEKISATGLNYKLKLYAVYANDYIKVDYNYFNGEKKNLICPVYVNGDHTQSLMGGITFGPESDKFIDYGLSVIDDCDLDLGSGSNFCGWYLSADDLEGVNPTIVEKLTNKIWFPGELLPALDFNLNFRPIIRPQGNNTITVGKTRYNIKALTIDEAKSTSKKYFDGYDVIAFPSGDYTIHSNIFNFTHTNEVRVVIPAEKNSHIELQPLAIHCDQIVEFYISDNLYTGEEDSTIIGSPVVGANFKAYRVKKGYRVYDYQDTKTISDVQEATDKYNFAATMQGLLIGKNNHTLLSVPSNTDLNDDTALLNALNQYQINHIVEYALAEMVSLSTIDLNVAAANLRIDANALYGSNARTIILPISSNAIVADCIAGAHTKLGMVKFWDSATSKYVYESNYAFTDTQNGFVYFDQTGTKAKTYLMYVLQSAAVTSLNQYLPYNYKLQIDDDVVKINPDALMGRDWRYIDYLVAMNPKINLSRGLHGLPDDTIIFVDRNYGSISGKLQYYQKELNFICDGYEPVTLTYVYGQPFTFFDPKENNPHNFIFDRANSKFVAWSKVGEMNQYYRVNASYRVGIPDEDGIIHVDDGMYFNASGSACWQSYLVQFHIYDGNTLVDYQPTTLLQKGNNNIRSMSELIGETGRSLLSEVYLPGMEIYFTTIDGAKYQFIGWGTSEPHNFSERIWANVDAKKRILPDKTATLNSGAPIRDNGIMVYHYYALYDLVTDNIAYTLISNKNSQSYTVGQNTNARPTTIAIPYAKYYNGFMVPITKVANHGFNALTGINEIVIGGAINEIGTSAFEGLSATVTFLHKYQADAPELVIGARAFYGNKGTQFKTIILPAAVTEIGESAFSMCTNLQAVYFEGYQITNSNIKHAINRVGRFAFRYDNNMTYNMIADYIDKDVAGTKRRFFAVGEGVFLDTKVKIVGKNKIVWIDTLLHSYDSNSAELVVAEKNISGYAFAGLNGPDANQKVTKIRIDNPEAVINANAFSYMSSDIKEVNLLKINTPKNVPASAFNLVTNSLNLLIGETSRWTHLVKYLPSNITFNA